MQRAEYLNDVHVRGFIEWATPLASSERSLQHHWHSPKWGSWSCETLYGAYLAYDWGFSVVLPGSSEPGTGHSYSDTIAVLDLLAQQLRLSGAEGDAQRFLEAAVAVVHWGQVRRNEARLRALGDELLPQVTAAARQLDPVAADLQRLSDVRWMNSGFSKIYSLLLDGFPIYDSRVACALASLVRLFCEETGRREVPGPLAFGIPASRGSANRDPSDGPLVFPRLWPGHPRRYSVSNVMAAWLLDALSAESPFAELGAERPRALQSAMFMVGYAPVTRLGLS